MLITQHALVTLKILKQDYASSRTPWIVAHAACIARFLIVMRGW